MHVNKSIVTVEQQEFYSENGYLVMRDFFSHADCDWMLSVFKKHVGKNFKALMNIEDKEQEIAERIIKNPLLVSVVESLWDMAMCAVGSQVLFKQVGTPYAEHAWNVHQDSSYLEVPSGTHVSAIIALEDSDPMNGGMYIYPGSHEESLLSYDPHPSFDPCKNPGNSIKKVPDKYQRECLYLSKGSLYVQHGYLIHGSYPNTSKKRSRPHFSVMYVKEGIPFNAGKNCQRHPISLH